MWRHMLWYPQLHLSEQQRTVKADGRFELIVKRRQERVLARTDAVQHVGSQHHIAEVAHRGRTAQRVQREHVEAELKRSGRLADNRVK